MTHTQDLHAKRPVSPHLSVYRLQINMILSMGHRFSGIALFIGLSIISWWLIFCIFSRFDEAILSLVDCCLVKIALYGLSFALFFHLCMGIRHFNWDLGRGFALKSTALSGWLVIIGSVVLTTILWTIIFW